MASALRSGTRAGFMVRTVVVASLDIACRKAYQQMWCAMVGLDLVCVELLGR